MYVRTTTETGRVDLARDCLEQLRMWPGCETVVEVGVLAEPRDRFLGLRESIQENCRSGASMHWAGEVAALSS
jgi:hypothetical protein